MPLCVIRGRIERSEIAERLRRIERSEIAERLRRIERSEIAEALTKQADICKYKED